MIEISDLLRRENVECYSIFLTDSVRLNKPRLIRIIQTLYYDYMLSNLLHFGTNFRFLATLRQFRTLLHVISSILQQSVSEFDD